MKNSMNFFPFCCVHVYSEKLHNKKKKKFSKPHNPEKRVTIGLAVFLHSIAGLGCQSKLLIEV